MHYFYEPAIAYGRDFLNEEESNHALRIMRLQKGDFIEVLDGKGTRYHCRITNTGKSCEYEILKLEVRPVRPYSIHIAISPTRNQERMEWFIEKVTEIGIEKVSFIITRHTEKSRLRMERIIKKAIGAMKQSMNLWLPEINAETDFMEFIANCSTEKNKFIAYVDESHREHLKDAILKGQPVLVLIGPEGDFSKEEISEAMKMGFKPVSLGPSRLRTETAGIVACHTINLVNWREGED